MRQTLHLVTRRDYGLLRTASSSPERGASRMAARRPSEPFATLAPSDRREVEDEAERLEVFLAD